MDLKSLSIKMGVAPPFVVMGITLVGIWLFQALLKQINRKWQRKAALPPGSMGLPLLGETFEFFARSPSLDLLPFFKRRMERYGPIFKTNLVGKDLIVSLDPEVNHYVLQQEEKAFHIWFPESFMRLLGEENIARCYGSLHKNTRNLIRRVFGPENLRLVLLHDMQGAVEKCLSSWHDSPNGVELKPALSSMIFGIAAKWMIGHEASVLSGDLWKNFDAFNQGLLSFPIHIPGTAFYRCMQGRNNVMKTLKQVLDDRKKAGTRERMDFIDVVVSELSKENPALSENLALNVLFLLIFASFETTSSALTAAVKFLLENPKALQELEDEHQQIRKRRADPDAEITWEEYKSMKFTSNVINESLRLANVAPVLFRKAIKDVQIKGYTIPEGWIVMICPPAVHFNPTTYEDPSAFNPWRWKDLPEPVGGSKDFIAFGSGLRLCVGIDFARLQMAMFLHFLVTKYRYCSKPNVVTFRSIFFNEKIIMHGTPQFMHVISLMLYSATG
ncbi:unnamed protein product [Urochloa decumbens]|uniref:Cytochrome P450 87A3 n=1 Tax=Urochloa decumbens TaxID=240449 RepID=A0ABC8WUL6_9POAL